MILDTTFLIDLLKNKKEAVEKARDLENSFEPISTTTISVFEIWQGLKNSEASRIKSLLSSLGTFGLDIESAIMAGDISRDLSRKGQKIDSEDCMIAGIVIKNKETLLTRNINHFSRIHDLKVVGY